MPKYLCSYAHDISCFADFVVEAKTEKAALRRIKKALREGKFESVETTPCFENGTTNERVYVQGPAVALATEITFEQLIGQEHLFSIHTGRCIRCDQSAEADAVENTPCQPQTIDRKET